MMIISNLMMVKYISRPNRFTIEFKNEKNELEIVHLHDPGRLKELLIPNTDVLVKYVPTYKSTGRKTKYDVIAIKYLEEWVLLNSSYHNKIVSGIIKEKKIKEIKDFHIYKPEYTYGNSRLDFLLKEKESNDNDKKVEFLFKASYPKITQEIDKKLFDYNKYLNKVIQNIRETASKKNRNKSNLE